MLVMPAERLFPARNSDRSEDGTQKKMQPDPERIMASGTWLYDGTVPCRIVTQKEDLWPAFDDPEDDPNAEDKVMPCVSVWFQSPGGEFQFSAGGGYYHTVEEAMAAVEKILPNPVRWDRTAAQ
jgi:hypothetical protein